MEVAPFFVDFHHFLSIFTIFCRFSPFFCRFSRFTHFCRDLHSVEIYALFPPIFLAKIAIPATSHVFSMYGFSLPSFHTKGKHSANLDFDTETISTLCQSSGNSKTGGVKFQYFFLPIFGHCERFQIKLELESTAF